MFKAVHLTFLMGGVTTTALIFVRHGVTEENLNHTLIGHTDARLHKLGALQAQAVSERLQRTAIDKVYSSPLTRCLETANFIAASHDDLVVRPHKGLIEMHLGIVDGMSSFLAYERYRSLMDQALDETLPDFQFPSGELRSDALYRFETVLDSLVSHHPSGTVCVVTHGGPLGLWLAHRHGECLGRFRHWQPHNASLTYVSFKDGEYHIDSMGQTDHLSDDLMSRINKIKRSKSSPS